MGNDQLGLEPPEIDKALRDNLFAPLNLNGAIRTEEVTVQFESNSPAGAETSLEVNESLEVDASTGVALDGDIVDGAGNNKVAAETSDFGSSPFIRDRPVAVMIEPFASGSDVTSQDGVVNFDEGI